MTRAEIEASYAISRRIEAEERCLDNAVLVFTSTQQASPAARDDAPRQGVRQAESRPLAAQSQEIQEQWGLYDGYNHNLARVLRFRRSSGRRMPLMKVSAPGLDFSSMKVRRACFGRNSPSVRNRAGQAAASVCVPLGCRPADFSESCWPRCRWTSRTTQCLRSLSSPALPWPSSCRCLPAAPHSTSSAWRSQAAHRWRRARAWAFCRRGRAPGQRCRAHPPRTWPLAVWRGTTRACGR